MDPVTLEMVAGLPYNRHMRVTNGKSIWPELDQFEVRSQIRAKKDENSELLGTLTPYLTKEFDGEDIVVYMELTGAQTRTIPKTGYYDIIISDVGTVDARAFPILMGKVKVGVLTTAAADV